MKNAMDKLINRIKETNNPTVMGLDPRYDMIPESIRTKYSEDIEVACKAILEINKELIDSVYDIVPAVKPQIAFYEMFGEEGIKVFNETCKYAKQKGMIIIADVKRGEEKVSIYDVDFVTVNPYLGIDGVKPFIDDCKEYGKGIFILVKTSNKSSGELQDLKLENGTTIYEKVAELVNSWGEDLVGEYGYSSVGAVVGATYPIQIKELREIMPKTYFLIPGYGAQGGKAEDIALGFKDGIGGIVNASRSLMSAYKSDRWKDKYSEKEFGKATRAEAIRMRDELNKEIIN